MYLICGQNEYTIKRTVFKFLRVILIFYLTAILVHVSISIIFQVHRKNNGQYYDNHLKSKEHISFDILKILCTLLPIIAVDINN